MKFYVFTLFILMSFLSCKNKKIQSETIEQSTEKEVIELETTSLIQQAKDEFPDSLMVRLQRTACFGRCPIYTLSIFQNGTAIYKGEKWVEKEGLFKSRVNKRQLEQIFSKAKEISFYKMKEQYDNAYITDLPSTITTLKTDSGFKIVANRYEGPEELQELERLIDDIANSLEWEQIKSE